MFFLSTQPAITCSKLTLEILETGVVYIVNSEHVITNWDNTNNVLSGTGGISSQVKTSQNLGGDYLPCDLGSFFRCSLFGLKERG